MTSKVNFSFDKLENGIAVATVLGGDYNKEVLYLHDEAHSNKGKKGVKEIKLGKHLLGKLSPRQESEVMRVLGEAKRRNIPPEHLNLDIPGAEEAYREMLGLTDEVEGQKKIVLPPGSNFGLIPSRNPEKREVWYIAGASGSGKSYIAKRLAEEYRKQYPDRDVYLIYKLK
jgi:hypothetical protein